MYRETFTKAVAIHKEIEELKKCEQIVNQGKFPDQNYKIEAAVYREGMLAMKQYIKDQIDARIRFIDLL